jgi:polysaccharide export outer membrane protein
MIMTALAAPLGGQSTDYRIGPKDVFWIIGRVKAGGLTLRQFETELRSKLAAGYFVNPQVSVSVDAYRSQRVFVVGDVRAPGEYPLTGSMSLIELLARAGATPTGDILIVQKSEGRGPVAIGTEISGDLVRRVDIRTLQSGTRNENVELRDGDTIFVPPAESIYVAGFVKNAGAYPIRRDTTVLQALVLAGGVTPEGASNRIRIVRFVNGKKVELKNVALSEIVKPGDTILVPERYL